MCNRIITNPMERDHIVPLQLGGSDNDINKRRIPQKKHRARHAYFGNKHIVEEIEQILLEAGPALQRKSVMQIRELLYDLMVDDMIYENGVWR